MPSPERVKHVFEQMKAAQRIREAQQGLGRPIISARSHGQQLVAVGNRLYHSSSWKTFPDFLNDYLKRILDPAWGNAEIAKSFAERHTVMQWYDAVCRFQQKMIKVPGEVHNSTMPGVVICFLGLAYNLYLLGHNVELQNRLIRRLKDPGNFQGAYYELIVANTLIRAGFKLTLEDETDGTSKHCEFAAVSQRTGKKYWVEAKMRAVRGFFGKGDHDGSVDPNPISHLIPHLNGALAKPAADERLIFIDLNTDAEAGKPAWVEKAATRLERYETEKLSFQAYVFVTNMPFHRSLDHDVVPVSILPFGLGMKDFGRPGYRRLSEMYRTKQKYRDAHDIAEAMTRYPQIPSTFDGALPSESFGRTSSRVLIGETYNFEGLGEGGVIGTVTASTVSEVEKQAYIGIVDQHGQRQILRTPMSEGELADYKAHPDAYFGRIQPVQKKVESRYELFEWFMEAHKTLPRERILESFKQAPNLEELKKLGNEELRAILCESLAASVPFPKDAAKMESPGDRSNPPALG